MFKEKALIKKEGIHTLDDANNFFDKIIDKLDNDAVKRAYYGALKKHERKNTANTQYMVDYFKRKLEERGIKI